ncbi:MAG: hemolysin, partial [Sphingobacteriaceae bacterium]
MKVITTEEFAKATKLDKLKMPGLAALLMELMKINQVNELFAQAQPNEGPAFVDAILKGCGVTIE